MPHLGHLWNTTHRGLRGLELGSRGFQMFFGNPYSIVLTSCVKKPPSDADVIGVWRKTFVQTVVLQILSSVPSSRNLQVRPEPVAPGFSSQVGSIPPKKEIDKGPHKVSISECTPE